MSCYKPSGTFYFLWLELKYTWHAAVINSAEELEFILNNLNTLSNKQDLYIGGTTNLNSSGFISNISDYIINSSGIT